MAGFTHRTTQKMDIVFVLALLTLFAATSFILVLIGAKQYRLVTNVMNENHETRTTASYLTEKIRRHDTADGINICDLNGTTALSIAATEEGTQYITYIFYYENALRELVVTENSVFSLSSGQAIIEMQGLELDFYHNSLLRVKVTNTNGEKQTFFLPLHSSVGKEEL